MTPGPTVACSPIPTCPPKIAPSSTTDDPLMPVWAAIMTFRPIRQLWPMWTRLSIFVPWPIRGLSQRSTIDRSVRANLYVIFNDEPTLLREHQVAAVRSSCVPEPQRPQHCARLHLHTIAQHHASLQHRPCTHGAVTANANTVANHSARPNTRPLANRSRGSYCRRGVYTRSNNRTKPGRDERECEARIIDANQAGVVYVSRYLPVHQDGTRRGGQRLGQRVSRRSKTQRSPPQPRMEQQRGSRKRQHPLRHRLSILQSRATSPSSRLAFRDKHAFVDRRFPRRPSLPSPMQPQPLLRVLADVVLRDPRKYGRICDGIRFRVRRLHQ